MCNSWWGIGRENGTKLTIEGYNVVFNIKTNFEGYNGIHDNLIEGSILKV